MLALLMVTMRLLLLLLLLYHVTSASHIYGRASALLRRISDEDGTLMMAPTSTHQTETRQSDGRLMCETLWLVARD